jgi:hypothetical protein
VITAYALGWGVADYRGHRALSHGGGVAGQITRTALFPDQSVALAIYSNSQEEEAISALRYVLADRLLGAPPFDWLAFAHRAVTDGQAEAVKASAGGFAAPPGGPTLPLDRYAGRYRDPWYGDMLVTLGGGALAIDFTHTPALKSALTPFGPDAFRTHFQPGVEDAVVSFAIKDAAVAGVSLKALSPLADFSFDFQDLAFTPVSH